MIGQAIRQIRKERGLTQEDLAEKMNTTQITVSRWERVCPPRTRIPDIASELGVTQAELYRRADEIELEQKEDTKDEPPAPCI